MGRTSQTCLPKVLEIGAMLLAFYSSSMAEGKGPHTPSAQNYVLAKLELTRVVNSLCQAPRLSHSVSRVLRWYSLHIESHENKMFRLNYFMNKNVP